MDRQRLSDFYIHFHFLQFAKLYNNERNSGAEALNTCRLHLQACTACILCLTLTMHANHHRLAPHASSVLQCAHGMFAPSGLD